MDRINNELFNHVMARFTDIDWAISSRDSAKNKTSAPLHGNKLENISCWFVGFEKWKKAKNWNGWMRFHGWCVASTAWKWCAPFLILVRYWSMHFQLPAGHLLCAAFILFATGRNRSVNVPSKDTPQSVCLLLRQLFCGYSIDATIIRRYLVKMGEYGV